MSSSQNAIGYGPGKDFKPPLQNPQSARAQLDKRSFLEFFNGLGFSHGSNIFVTIGIYFGWLIGYIYYEIFNGEGNWDFLIYNNWFAAGEQLYPEGIFMYYDMLSYNGMS